MKKCNQVMIEIFNYIGRVTRDIEIPGKPDTRWLLEEYVSCIEVSFEEISKLNLPLLVGWSGELEATALTSTMLYGGIVIQDSWTYYALTNMLQGKAVALLVNPWFRPYLEDIVSSVSIRRLLDGSALIIIPHRRLLWALGKDGILGKEAESIAYDVSMRYEMLFKHLKGVVPRYVVGGLSYASTLGLDVVSDDEDIMYMTEQGVSLLRRRINMDASILNVARELEALKADKTTIKVVKSREALEIIKMAAWDASHKKKASLKLLMLLLRNSKKLKPEDLVDTAIKLSRDTRIGDRIRELALQGRKQILLREILTLLGKIIITGYSFLTLPLTSLLLASHAEIGAGITLLPQILLSTAIATDDALNLLQSLKNSRLFSALRPNMGSYIFEFTL